MATNVPVGHALARKVYGAAVFAEMVKKPGFLRNLTGSAPKIGSATNKLEKMQTSPAFPIVQVTDLSKGKGDKVSVDCFNILQGLPFTGDETLEGKTMDLDSSSMDISIDQIRGGANSGGKMAQQRTIHQLRPIAKAALAGWWSRLVNQVSLAHLAGDRGDMDTASWVLPLASHAKFNSIMVNSMLAPTYQRHMYAGDATSLTTLTTNDYLKLEDIDRMKAYMDELEFPLQPIVIPDDNAAHEEPLYCLYVTPRQYHFLITESASGKDWRTFAANAQARGSKNPIFAGGPLLWNGILIKKMPSTNVIRFHQGVGRTVATSADTFATNTVTIGATQFGTDTVAGDYAVDRAILMGAQAMAMVYGNSGYSDTPMNWSEKLLDHDNLHEVAISAIGGCSKLRFTDSNGVDYDHGVIVMDSYAPNPEIVRV